MKLLCQLKFSSFPIVCEITLTVNSKAIKNEYINRNLGISHPSVELHKMKGLPFVHIKAIFPMTKRNHADQSYVGPFLLQLEINS